MSAQRLALNALVLILALTSLAWIAIARTLQPDVIPVPPLVSLAVAAVLGAGVWLTRGDEEALEPPVPQPNKPGILPSERPFERGFTAEFSGDIPDWLASMEEAGEIDLPISPARASALDEGDTEIEFDPDPTVVFEMEDDLDDLLASTALSQQDPVGPDMIDTKRDAEGIYSPEPPAPSGADVIDTDDDPEGIFVPRPPRREPMFPDVVDTERDEEDIYRPEPPAPSAAVIETERDDAVTFVPSPLRSDPIIPEMVDVEMDEAPVQFAAFYPSETLPHERQPLKAYVLRDTAYPDVVIDAREQFDLHASRQEVIPAALQSVPHDTLVTAIPHVPGLEFDPPQVSVQFRKAWQRFDFEYRAVNVPLDESADGRITFFVEGVIVADVKLSVFVSEQITQRIGLPRETTAKPYHAVFCCYSHEDAQIVTRVEISNHFHFTRFMRDMTTLRSAEHWNESLLDLVEDADIFQLFWSEAAAVSDYVRREWAYALALRKNGAKSRHFIRPVRWEEPMVPPPPELSDLHFDLIESLAGS